MAFVLYLCIVLMTAARAAEPFRVEVTDAKVPIGTEGAVVVTLVIPPEYHVYRDSMDVTALQASGVTTAAPRFPPGEVVPDPAFPGMTREQYTRFVSVDVPVKPSTAAEHDLKLVVRYQGCKKDLCMLAQTEEVVAKVTGLAKSSWRWPGLLVGSALAQDPTVDEVAVRFSAASGVKDHASVRVDLEGDWHLNKMFMRAELKDAPGLTGGEANLPAAHPSGSEADGTFREDFTSDFDLHLPVTGPAGEHTVKVVVGYQACKGVSLCRMPTEEVVEVPLSLTGAALSAIVPPVRAETKAAAPAHPAPPSEGSKPPAGDDEGALPEGLVALLFFCFTSGVLASFTPCVLPMVPITMSIIGARSAGNRLGALSLAATYVAGLVIFYTALAVFVASTGQMFGVWLQSPWVVGGIGALFLVMGAGMFGLFDMQLPASWTAKLQGGARGRAGYASAFTLGVVGALVAGPCTGPVVVAILGIIATKGVAYGAMLMATFSLGLGLIFLVTGATGGWMPSRGPWMAVVKKSFGVVMWLGALYYARSLLTDTQLALATAAVLLSTAVFAWPAAEEGEGYAIERARQLYAVVGGLVGAYLLVGTLAREGFILPGLSLAAPTATETIPWLDNEESALAQARAAGKPLMIDFTADWCTACHEMEKYTYTDPGVVAAAGGFVPVMIDCTNKADPVVEALLKKYDVLGLPKVVFVTAEGKVLGHTQDYVPPEAFLPKMKAALEKAG